MEAALPSLRDIAGNIAMPGFTAPKIAWVHDEPEICSRIAKILLPKGLYPPAAEAASISRR